MEINQNANKKLILLAIGTVAAVLSWMLVFQDDTSYIHNSPMKIELPIKRIERATPDSVTLIFDKVKELAYYKPGQHVSLSVVLNNETVSRTYSLNSSPDVDDCISITVRLIAEGKLSSYLVNHAEVGENVLLEGPHGDFFVEPSVENKRHLVLFAGGSGITPLISIIKTILIREPLSKISLIYSNRSEERIIFKLLLAKLQVQFSDSFRVFHIISQPTITTENLPVFYRGQLSKLIVRKHLKNMLLEIQLPVEFFLCGPMTFMQMVEEAITSLRPEAKINKESFFIPFVQREPLFDYEHLSAREVTIQWKNTAHLIHVKGGLSILAAALLANLPLPHSCMEGQCGSCRSILLAGEVRMRKNHILNEDELQQSQILLCQAYPVSDKVRIRTIH